MEKPCKCGNPNVVIKPDGINELDPCFYKVEETYRNVSVEISRCMKCGRINISWFRQSNTERID